jgi:ADP-heptose:LPS heptosyltransferase
MDEDPKQKVLIIRFSSIGDIVLTTPIIRAVKKQLPNSQLHFLTKERNAIIVQNNPYVDKIHTFKSNISEVMKDLRQEGFSDIVDLQKNLRSSILIAKLFKPYHTFAKLNIRKWLLTQFKINLLPDMHIVDRYFQAVRKLNVHNDGLGTEYFLQEQDYEAANLPQNFLSEGYVAIACGSIHTTKQIPADILINICSQLSKFVVLVGDKKDRDRAIKIENAVGAKVFNACGAFNLNQTASILANSSLIITGDTGLMHIAAALKKNIICLWGNTVLEFGMSAYKPLNADFEVHNFEVKGLKCRPCSKLGYSSCPKKHFKCMKLQQVDKIIDCANKIID